MITNTALLAAALAPALLSSSVLAQDNQTFVDYSVEPNPDLFPDTVPHTLATLPDCMNGPLSETLACNSSASHADRAYDLVTRFTFEELINNTENSSPGVPRLGLPPYQWWTEVLHGLARAMFQEPLGAPFSYATSFPQPILTIASLNTTLISLIADITSTQARAYYNSRFSNGINGFAPNVNCFREARWGRGQETPGEDPFLSSVYAYHWISAVQGGIDSKTIKILATVKHFAGYDQENVTQHSRLGFDARITRQELIDYYTPPFRTAVKYARSASVMCSYNAVNGTPSCANELLLKSLLRETWNFPEYGYVSSDCDSIYNIHNPHEYADDLPAAAAAALRAGTDLDCGKTYPMNLKEAFERGMVTREEIERSVIRRYMALMRAGYFDKDSPYSQLDWDDVVQTDQMDLAYEAVAQSVVLMKNDGTLPLSLKIRRLAIIGPLANATTEMQGNYVGTAGHIFSVLEAAVNAGFEVDYALGTEIDSNSEAGFAEAIRAAQNADAVIYMGGIDNTIEMEAHDRENVEWPGNQLKLIWELSMLGKPLSVLVMGGGQVDSSSLKHNTNVNAILWVGYPSQDGGRAIMDILRGMRAPAGRLPLTQYPAEYVEQFPNTTMNLRPDGKDNPGQTHMWYTGKPVYPFGHGLFYTTFKESLSSSSSKHGKPLSFDISELLGAPHPDYQHIEQGPILTFSANVKNIGKVLSPYTALLYAHTSNGGPAPYPIKRVVGISRLEDIQPGHSAQLNIDVSILSISRVDEEGNRKLYPGTYTLFLNNERSVVLEFTLTGHEAVLEAWPEDDEQ